MSERIPLSVPHLTGNVQKYLQECLDTNFVSSVGPFVDRFEREFAAFVGAKHAVACASGTAAIHVALRLCGVGPGDEVLVPTLTFIASANPVVYEHATPVFVDSEPRTWNLDPALVVEELERRARAGKRQPKAVEVVHLLGHPAEIEPIREACERHGVALVEDAAEALGATYRGGRLEGKHVGTVGKLGCFSFNGNKVITTGGGGMIVTDDAELARRAKHLTTQARLPGRAYRHDEVGYNYRLTNLAAAMGVAQLEELPGFLRRKRQIADRYDAALRGVAGITPPPRAPWAAPSLWLYTASEETRDAGEARDRILDRLGEAGIEARPIWSPLHTMPMYRASARLGDGSVAEGLAAHGLSLPCSVGLTDAEQERVLAVLRAARG
jgi:aminotransferase in exopolysaccharide biosynthesis